jgi:hypothetical protein
MVVSVRSCAIRPAGAALGADQSQRRSPACLLAAVEQPGTKLALSALGNGDGPLLTDKLPCS